MRFASSVLVAFVALAGCKDDNPEPASDDDAGDETGSDDGSESGDSGDGEESGESGNGSGESGEIGEGPWDSFAERPCPPESFLTYENFGLPHMLTFCNGCHSSMLPADMRQMAPLEVNFDSLDDVRDQAAKIWARSGDQHDTMPPVGAAAEDERYLLGEWLACGAPTDDDLAD